MSVRYRRHELPVYAYDENVIRSLRRRALAEGCKIRIWRDGRNAVHFGLLDAETNEIIGDYSNVGQLTGAIEHLEQYGRTVEREW